MNDISPSDVVARLKAAGSLTYLDTDGDLPVMLRVEVYPDGVYALQGCCGDSHIDVQVHAPATDARVDVLHRAARAFMKALYDLNPDLAPGPSGNPPPVFPGDKDDENGKTGRRTRR